MVTFAVDSQNRLWRGSGVYNPEGANPTEATFADHLDADIFAERRHLHL